MQGKKRGGDAGAGEGAALQRAAPRGWGGGGWSSAAAHVGDAALVFGEGGGGGGALKIPPCLRGVRLPGGGGAGEEGVWEGPGNSRCPAGPGVAYGGGGLLGAEGWGLRKPC